MERIDELELDNAGYPDIEFQDLEDGGEAAEEIELLMRCVNAARQCA